MALIFTARFHEYKTFEHRVFDQPDGWRQIRRRPRPRRPTPPTRDPHTPGYVAAKELPDGAVPPADADGNFIIGPTHNRAPEMTVQEGVPQGTVFNFTMNSADSKIYPGIARDANTFGTPDPDRSRQTCRDHQPSGSLHAPSGRLCPQAIRPRHGRAVHRRGGRTRPGAVHGARQSDRPAPRAGDDRHLDRQRQRRRPRQPARPGIRHHVRPVRGVRREGSAAARGKEMQREIDQGSRRPGDDGLQLRRLVRTRAWPGITPTCITACSPIRAPT